MHNNILEKNYFMVKSNICLLSTSLFLFYYLTFSGFRCNQKSPTWVGLLLSKVYPLSVSTAVHVIAVILRAFNYYSAILRLFIRHHISWCCWDYLELRLLRCAMLWLWVHSQQSQYHIVELSEQLDLILLFSYLSPNLWHMIVYR